VFAVPPGFRQSAALETLGQGPSGDPGEDALVGYVDPFDSLVQRRGIQVTPEHLYVG
jgi:hypothetical protein